MKLVLQPRQKSKLYSDDFESWPDLTLNKNIIGNIYFNVYKQVIQQRNKCSGISTATISKIKAALMDVGINAFNVCKVK